MTRQTERWQLVREADSGGVCAWRPRGLSFLCLCLSSNNLNTTASGHPGGGWLEHAHKPACCCTKRGSHKRSRKRHKAFIVTPPPTNPVKGVNSFLCGYAGSGINMLWLRLHDVLLVDEICQEHMILTPPPPPLSLAAFLLLQHGCSGVPQGSFQLL